MKLQDINFGTDECIYDYKRCFELKGKVYEYLKPGGFRVIFSNDDYDYIEDGELTTYLYKTYIAELECMLKVEKHTTSKLNEYVESLQQDINTIINAQ